MKEHTANPQETYRGKEGRPGGERAEKGKLWARLRTIPQFCVMLKGAHETGSGKDGPPKLTRRERKRKSLVDSFENYLQLSTSYSRAS